MPAGNSPLAGFPVPSNSTRLRRSPSECVADATSTRFLLFFLLCDRYHTFISSVDADWTS